MNGTKERIKEIKERFGSAMMELDGLMNALGANEDSLHGWIDVKDNNPCSHPELRKSTTDTMDVLVVEEDRMTHDRRVAIGYMTNTLLGLAIERWVWICSAYHDVVYWMPLPQLPKGGEP